MLFRVIKSLFSFFDFFCFVWLLNKCTKRVNCIMEERKDCLKSHKANADVSFSPSAAAVLKDHH